MINHNALIRTLNLKQDMADIVAKTTRPGYPGWLNRLKQNNRTNLGLTYMSGDFVIYSAIS